MKGEGFQIVARGEMWARCLWRSHRVRRYNGQVGGRDIRFGTTHAHDARGTTRQTDKLPKPTPRRRKFSKLRRRKNPLQASFVKKAGITEIKMVFKNSPYISNLQTLKELLSELSV